MPRWTGRERYWHDWRRRSTAWRSACTRRGPMLSDTEMRAWRVLMLVLFWGSLGYVALSALFAWPLVVATPLGQWLSWGGLGLLAVLPTRIAWRLLRAPR